MASGDHTWPGLTPVLGSAKDHTQRVCQNIPQPQACP